MNLLAIVSPCVPTSFSSATFELGSHPCVTSIISNPIRQGDFITLAGLYLGCWLHGSFAADDRNSSGAFFAEVDQHAILHVPSSACFGSFQLRPWPLQTEHDSAVFSSFATAWRLNSGTDALFGPRRIARLDQINQSLPPCLELLLGYMVSCNAPVRSRCAEIVEMLCRLVQQKELWREQDDSSFLRKTQPCRCW